MTQPRAVPPLLAMLLVALPGPAFAQGAASANDPPGGDLSGEVSVSRLFASALGGPDSDEEDSGSSVILRGGFDYVAPLGGAELTLSYDTAKYLYDDDNRDDRWSNRGAAGVETALGETITLFAQGSYASNISTVESGSSDQTEVLGRIAFAPDETHRLRAFGGYRWREYDFDGSDGRGAFFGAEYRYRLAANHYLTAEARHEDIQSDSPTRGFDRTTAELFYQRPIVEDVQLRAGATARWWDFDGRPAPNGERLERRSLTPELQLQYATRPGLLLRGRVQHVARDSNNPQYAIDEQRALLTAGYRF